MTSSPYAPSRTSDRRVVMGRVTEVEEPYGREVAVPAAVLYPLVLLAVVVDIVGLVLRGLLRLPVPSARRPLKVLRKGPEYVVTTVWVRDADDSLVELEVHGHLNPSAVLRTDRIRTVARRQKGDLPLLAGPIENLTTGRVLRPRPATLLTHLGLGLVLQALLGAVLVTLLLAALLGHR